MGSPGRPGLRAISSGNQWPPFGVGPAAIARRLPLGPGIDLVRPPLRLAPRHRVDGNRRHFVAGDPGAAVDRGPLGGPGYRRAWRMRSRPCLWWPRGSAPLEAPRLRIVSAASSTPSTIKVPRTGSSTSSTITTALPQRYPSACVTPGVTPVLPPRYPSVTPVLPQRYTCATPAPAFPQRPSSTGPAPGC